MVTRILLDPRRDLPGGNGFTSDPIVLEATPTSIREDGSVFVLPTTLSFTVNTAADVVQLPPPAASWAWRLVARQDGVPVQQRTVRFPDVPSVGYADLTDVDPASLGETRGHARQWDATFFQLVTLIGQLQDEVAALTQGAPGSFDTFLEVATRMGLDETSITALQGLVAGKANAADLVALATTVAGKASIAQITAAIASQAATDAGIYATQAALAGVGTASTRLDPTVIPALTTLQTDSFVGSTGPLTAHPLASGPGTWSQSSGSFVLDGNGAVTLAAVVNGACATLIPAQPNYTFTTTLVSRANTGTEYSRAGVVWSWIDASNHFYAHADIASSSVNVHRVTAGVTTQLAGYVVPGGLFTGLPFTVRVDHWGSDTTLWVNGVEVVTIPDPQSATTTGAIGLRSGSNGSTALPSWLDVTVTTFQGVRLNLPRPTKGNVANPIIPLGASGAWDDTDVNNPGVVWDPINNRWVMYYSGYHGANANVQHAGFAYSPSINGPWTKEATNPVFSSIGEDGFYAQNGGIVFWNGQWWMAYASNNGTTVRMATAPAITGPWTRRGVVLTSKRIDPFLRVRQDGQTLEMWHGVANSRNSNIDIAYASSTDGLNWTIQSAPSLYCPDFTVGNFSEPAVYVPPGREGQQMMVTYDIQKPWNSDYRYIGCAITSDGGATWHHALLSFPGSGWEAGSNFDSFPVVRDGRFYMFHGGTPGGGLALGAGIQIGVDSCDWNGQTLVIDQFSTALALTTRSRPYLTGTSNVGDTLTIAGGVWSSTPDLVTYQWYRNRVPITGATGASYTTVSADGGTKLGVAATASKTSYISAAAAFSDGISIAAAPTPDTTAPTITSFTATPSNAQVVLAWAGSDNVAITRWVAKRGTTTVYDGTATTFTDTGLTNGTAYSYTVTAYDAAGNSTVSNGANATPTASTVTPSITAQPTGQTIANGATVTFTAAAAGTPTPTVQWQRSIDSGSTWANISGATSASYAHTSATSESGYQYRAVFTNTAGTATTSAAALTVTTVGSHDPSTISGLIALYRADSITGKANGAAVDSWPDTSGNGYTMTNPSATTTVPTYQTNVQNGQPSVRFVAAAQQAMNSTAPSGGATQTVVTVISIASPTTGQQVLRAADGLNGLEVRLNAGKPNNLRQGTADIGSSSATLTAGASVVIATYDSTSGSTWRVNGTAAGTSALVGALTARGTALGGNPNNSGENLTGDILEQRTYSRVLTATEQALIDSYVQDRYAITVSDYS